MDYQLTQTGAQVQEILDDAPIIQQELEAVEALLPEDASTGNKLVDYNQMNTLLQAKQDKLTEQTTGTKVGDLSVKYGVNIGYGVTVGSDNQTKVTITPGSITKGQGANIFDALATIEAVIPSAASGQNKLTDKNYVDSAIATSSANFVGTFNSLAELQAVQNPTNNDYGFVIETDAHGNEYYDRYKFTGTQWLFEYKVESTPFTADQWAAIQSGITSALVTKLNALPTAQQLNSQLAGKQDTLTFDTTPTAGSTNPVTSAGVKTYVDNHSSDITVDSALSTTSENPVQNKVVTTELNGKQATISDLSTIRSGAAAGATAVQPATMNTALAAKQDTINTVNVTVDNNTGTPSGSASVSGGTMTLNFSNLKGTAGAQGPQGIQGVQGPQGPKGDTGVTGDASSLAIIHGIDKTSSYGTTDVCGADAAQALLNEIEGGFYY